MTNRAIYLALAINLEGKKEVLGLWSSENEGARFWLAVATELKNRGLQDIFICCVDGLSGFAGALEAIYPKCRVQRCIVHQLRNSLKYVNWKDRKTLAADLKTINTAPTELAARTALEAFRATHDAKHPAIGRSWEANWDQLTPFFHFPPPRSGRSSTPPTRSNRSTARSARSAATATSSPPSTRSSSCSI